MCLHVLLTCSVFALYYSHCLVLFVCHGPCHVMCVSCLVGYIIMLIVGGDIGHVGDVGHLFGVLCVHCTCLPVSVNTLHRKEGG